MKRLNYPCHGRVLLPFLLAIVLLWGGWAAAASNEIFRSGKRPYPPGTRDKWIAEGRVLGSAPRSFLRRSIAGKDSDILEVPSRKGSSGFADNSTNLPTIGVQGAENSCVFWSAAYVKTAAMKNRNPALDISNPANQSSPRFTYNLSNGGADIGAYGHEPYEIFMRYGSPSCGQIPYVAGQYTNLPVLADFLEGLHRRTTNYVWLWQLRPAGAQVEELKLLLDSGGVASCGLRTDSNFNNRNSLDPPWSGPVSGTFDHMVTVCGYGSTSGTNWYLIANSWGTNWGSNGFTHVAASYFTNHFCDVFYPLEGPYTPATNYIAVQVNHPRRSDLQAMELQINGSVACSFSPTPLDMPTNSGGVFLLDNRSNLNLAVDLSLASWNASSNLVTLRVGDRSNGVSGTIQNFSVVIDGAAYSSTTTPVNIPDNSGYGAPDVLLYRLNTEAGAHGSVSVSDQWIRAGITTSITAIANQYYHFTNWTGGVTGGAVYASPLALMMDQPKAVTAYFADNLTTNTFTPEAWLANYGYTDFAVDAVRDPFGKGMKIWQEYIAGTDPTNAQDMFKVESITNEAGFLALTFLGRTGRLYSAYCESNLVTGTEWGVLGVYSNIVGSNVVIEITDPDSLPVQRFYRVGVRLPD